MAISGRIRTLAGLELFNIGLFGVLLAMRFSFSPVNLAGYLVCSFLLAQGSAYWFLKLRQVRSGARFPAGLRWFAILRWVNPVLLTVGTGYVLAGVVTEPGSKTVPGLLLCVLAILEQVNYFHVQLSHDNAADLRRLLRTGLHRSHLATDLARHRRAGAEAGDLAGKGPGLDRRATP